MTSNILLRQFFLPQDSIKLGRFITSIDHPHQNYHDPTCAKAPQALISLRGSYTGTYQTDTSSGFGSALTSLMSAAFSKHAKTKVRVATDRVTTYILQNSDRWFEEATKMLPTRSWIERQVDQGYDIYVIVGFHTVTDARVIQEYMHAKSTEGQLKLPGSLSLTAVGAIAPLGNIIDPRVGGHCHDLDGANAQFLAPGEHVCALQCRKMCHKWLSSKNIDQSRLSKLPRWASVETWRDDEEGDDDIFEVELNEVKSLEGEWDREEVAGSEIFFVHSFEKMGS
jgi:hypothetical protein